MRYLYLAAFLEAEGPLVSLHYETANVRLNWKNKTKTGFFPFVFDLHGRPTQVEPLCGGMSDICLVLYVSDMISDI